MGRSGHVTVSRVNVDSLACPRFVGGKDCHWASLAGQPPIDFFLFVVAIMVASLTPTKIDWSNIDNPELVLKRFPSRRSVVYGTKGVVSSSQPLATAAGLEIQYLNKAGMPVVRSHTDIVAPISIKSPTESGVLTQVITVNETQSLIRYM